MLQSVSPVVNLTQPPRCDQLRPPIPLFQRRKQVTGPSGQPKLSALNSKLRRRNSHGSPLTAPPLLPGHKLGPQRTTKNAQKLKLLPNPDPGDDGPDEESGRDVYSQFTRIKDPTARRMLQGLERQTETSCLESRPIAQQVRIDSMAS